MKVSRSSPPRPKLFAFSPLGLRLFDPIEGRFVAQGYEVVARPVARPGTVRRALLSGDVFSFHDLPGLEELEREDSVRRTFAPEERRRFKVEITHSAGHHLPAFFEVDLPVVGPLRWPLSAPDATRADGVPLVASAHRPVPRGCAAVRAELRTAAGVAAGGAVLEARTAGRLLGRGVAGTDGQVLLLSPFPDPPLDDLDTPSGGARWSLDLTVRWDGQRERTAVDLDHVFSQPPARLWARDDTPLAPQTLRQGEELIVKSSNATGVPISALLVSAP